MLYFNPASIFLNVCLCTSLTPLALPGSGLMAFPHRCGEGDIGNPCKTHSTAHSMNTLPSWEIFFYVPSGAGDAHPLLLLPTFVSPTLWESQAKPGNWLEITLALSDLSSSLRPSPGSLSLLPQHSHLCCPTPLARTSEVIGFNLLGSRQLRTCVLLSPD